MKRTILYSTCVFLLLLTGTGFSEGTDSAQPTQGEAGKPTVKFHHMGFLTQITDEGIVLESRSLLFSPAIEFYSGTGERIARYDFHKGDKVSCLLDEKGKIAVLREVLPD